MIVCTNYHVTYKKNYYVIINHDIPICPACGSSVKPRDSRKRKVKQADGTVKIYALRRFHCPTCNKLHLEIPSEILPHKHYSRSTIEAVRNGNPDSCAADDPGLTE